MLQHDEITLDLRIPNGLQILPDLPEDERTWTLAEAIKDMTKNGLVRILDPEHRDEEISEQLHKFIRAVDRGESPSVGGVLAAYWVAVSEQATAEWMDDKITDRQRAARVAAATRLVFRRK